MSHSPNEPYNYPDVPKSLWCSSCGSRQNDHVRGCPATRGTMTIGTCQRCGEEGHLQEDCALIREPCQIYDQPSGKEKPFCQQCKKEGHWTKDCKKMMVPSEKRAKMNKYQEAYEDLRHRDPIASMDETTTEYPSRDYHQIDQMLEERRTTREQTPKRELNQREYQPQNIIPPNKIELNLQKSSWTPHRDTAFHDIYPIPEDEGGGGLNCDTEP